MAVQETILPDGDIASGAWTGTFADVDEAGAHDGDTTFRKLDRLDAVGITTSEFEVSLQNPAKYLANPQVRDAELWKTLLDLQVRDAEAWKPIQALSVRDAESWKLLVPRIVVRVTARNANSGSATVSYEVKLKTGITVIATLGGSGAVGSIYAETSFGVAASTLIVNNASPTDLRVAVEGTVEVITEGSIAELRVTQVKCELED